MNQLPVELGQAVKQAFAANAQLSAFTSLAAKAGQSGLLKLSVVRAAGTDADWTGADVGSAFQAAPKGKLHRVAVGLKDVFCTKELPTTAASNILKSKQHHPHHPQATHTRDAYSRPGSIGAYLILSVQTTAVHSTRRWSRACEMLAPSSSARLTWTSSGWGKSPFHLRFRQVGPDRLCPCRSTNENSHFGRVYNPAGPDGVDGAVKAARSAGGSSGGSAAAVAAGMCKM